MALRKRITRRLVWSVTTHHKTSATARRSRKSTIPQAAKWPSMPKISSRPRPGSRSMPACAKLTFPAVENATSPRFGASLRIPKLNWVFRGFYGHFYQAPPLLTVSGPLLQLATSQNLGFVPLWRARRGTPIRRHHPSSRLDTDADNFLTRANNFFDHNNFNNSEIFIPITIEGARVSGWELTLTASAQPWSDVPEVLKSARARLRWHQRRPHGLFFWRRLRVVGPRPAQHAPRGRPVLFPMACFCLHRSPTPPASATAINRR